MNPRRNPNHKICCILTHGLPSPSQANSPDQQASEAGYTMVALLALMTMLALFAVAAAPSIRQQSQREREKEAVFRGEQVAAAIRSYYVYRLSTRGGVGDQSLPTSIDQLLEGIPVAGGSKRRQILRASAARDPLSTSGEWRLIAPRAQSIVDFQRSVILYAGNFLPPPQDQQLLQLQQLAVPQIVNVLDTESRPPSSIETSSSESSGPFVGVASRSTNNSVLYYYGIDRHDLWIFTPLFR